MTVVLDTHALVWWVNGGSSLSSRQRRVLRQLPPPEPFVVCDITLWEIATLCGLGRLVLDRPLRDWLERAVAPPLVVRLGVSPAIASEVAALPASFHRDPADRIIVATARVLGAAVLTSDRRIIDAEVVPTI